MDKWNELRDQLERNHASLLDMLAGLHKGSSEYDRLRGKAQGVMLALIQMDGLDRTTDHAH